MAQARTEVVLMAMGTDGSPQQCYLEDTYNVNQETWFSSGIGGADAEQGSEWQWLMAMTYLVEVTWLHHRWGLLTPTVGTSRDGGNSGEEVFGTPV